MGDLSQDAKLPLTLGLTEPAKSFVELCDRIADDLTLRLLQALGSGLNAADRSLIQSECDLRCHTVTILPYSWKRDNKTGGPKTLPASARVTITDAHPYDLVGAIVS